MPVPASKYVCDWCKTVFVVPSLARCCEDKHLEESDEDLSEPDAAGG